MADITKIDGLRTFVKNADLDDNGTLDQDEVSVALRREKLAKKESGKDVYVPAKESELKAAVNLRKDVIDDANIPNDEAANILSVLDRIEGLLKVSTTTQAPGGTTPPSGSIPPSGTTPPAGTTPASPPGGTAPTTPTTPVTPPLSLPTDIKRYLSNIKGIQSKPFKHDATGKTVVIVAGNDGKLHLVAWEDLGPGETEAQRKVEHHQVASLEIQSYLESSTKYSPIKDDNGRTSHRIAIFPNESWRDFDFSFDGGYISEYNALRKALRKNEVIYVGPPVRERYKREIKGAIGDEDYQKLDIAMKTGMGRFIDLLKEDLIKDDFSKLIDLIPDDSKDTDSKTSTTGVKGL